MRASCGRVPSSTSYRIEYSARTLYSTSICLVLTQLYPWSKVALYFSPIISILSTVMYFGQWQSSWYGVCFSSLTGAAVGVLIGYSYQMKYLQIILLFVTLTAINRFSTWSRLTSVFCGIGLILGCLSPNITGGDVQGIESFFGIVALINIPFCITGVTLLLPVPALASNSARGQVSQISRKMVLLIRSMIRGFSCYDYFDLYGAEFDALMTEVNTDLSLLKVVIGYVESEVLVFNCFRPMLVPLQKFIGTMSKIVVELNTLRAIAVHIKNNKTHSTFIQYMHDTLVDIDAEVGECLGLVGECFIAFAPLHSCQLFAVPIRSGGGADRNPSPSDRDSYKKTDLERDLLDQKVNPRIPSALRPSNIRLGRTGLPRSDSDSTPYCYSLTDAIIDLENPVQETILSADSDSAHAQLKRRFQQASDRLGEARSRLVRDFQRGRKNILFLVHDSTGSISECGEAVGHNGAVKDEAICSPSDNTLRDFVNDIIDASSSKEHKADDGGTIDAADPSDASDTHTEADELAMKLFMNKETIKAGQRNFGPRCSALHRLTMVVELIQSLEACFNASERSPMLSTFLCSAVTSSFDYMVGIAMTVLRSDCGLRADSTIGWDWVWMKVNDLIQVNANAMKIALAITIGASMLIYQLVPFLFSDGLWSTVVIVLIRQNSTSSSFLMGYQRLEGTVVGAIYSFAVYQVMSCSSLQCGPTHIFPALLLWVAICCLFRDGPQHGYAATVASFTPIVLLYGASELDGTWGRIEETFLGIFLYLLIDNCILPVRIYPGLTTAVLDSIRETGLLFSMSMGSLRLLLVSNEQDSLSGCGSRETTLEAAAMDSLLVFSSSHDMLQAMEVHIASLSNHISTQELSLKMVTHEPELCYRTVPANGYLKLLQCFRKVLRSGEAVCSGNRAFALLLYQMMRREESVREQLQVYSFMVKHLLRISTEAEVALQLAYDSLHRYIIASVPAAIHLCWSLSTVLFVSPVFTIAKISSPT